VGRRLPQGRPVLIVRGIKIKKFLFVLRHPPYEGSGILESLDILMTVAAFDQSVRVLFLDDGVFLLKSGQCPHNPAVKPSAPWFAALAVYDIDELWVEEESLADRGLNAATLMLPVRTLGRAEIAPFIAAADIVVAC
jgi:tRNA 2-thiouridine synthesizing protein C